MATSGNADYTVTALDLITDALEDLGVCPVGETPAAEDSSRALRALNQLIKNVFTGGPKPLCPSMKLWKRKHLILDLTANEKYTVRIRRLAFTSGGVTAIAVGNTITGATSAATAKIMSVELSSGSWAAGDAAGEFIIESQAGTFQSENLNVLGLPANAATIADNSTQYGPPLEILNALRRDASGIDTPMHPMTLAEYLAIGDKDAEGTPGRYYFEKRKDEFLLYLNCKPKVTTDNMVMVVHLPIEDLDSLTNNLDFPREWERTLKFNLEQDLLVKYPSAQDRAKTVVGLAGQSMAANTFEPDDVVAYFEPDRED
jgi:hypothetical protein